MIYAAIWTGAGADRTEEGIVCKWESSSDSCHPVDSAQDDGTYGTGDPGIFFFTTEDVFVNTSVDYFYTTERIPSSLEIPKLG